MKRISSLGIAFIGIFLLNPLVADIAPKPSRFYTVSRNINSWPVVDTTVDQPKTDASTTTTPTTPSTSSTSPSTNGSIWQNGQKNPADFYGQETKNIVEKAKENSNLTTFVAALKAAGLLDTLSNGGPYTIFAPSNEAFNQLPKGVLDRLLKPENQKELIAILTYHVVPGKIMAKDAKTMKVRTLNGQDLNLEAAGGLITVDDAEVIKGDIKAKNGVIHVIDEVISPPAK